MAKIIPYTPYIERQTSRSSSVYAVVTVPVVEKTPMFQKRSLPKSIAWFLDVAVSLGLGAVMLVFLVLLLVSL